MKQVVIAGGVGKDAVIRTTNNGKKVTGWSVGVADGWGENKRTMWFECDWWGQRGEKVAEYIRKGVKITVSGELSFREYEGRTIHTISVSDVTLQGGGQSNQDSGYGGGGRPSNSGGGIDDDFDNIPFAACKLI